MSIDNIKVGDYARSYDGYIARCKRFYSYDNFVHFDKDIIDTCCEPTNYFEKKDIKKYIKVVSPNIIDLIEVGDYVNGRKVSKINLDKTMNGETAILCGDSNYDCLDVIYKNCNIKSIVTHEQMEEMEYKI